MLHTPLPASIISDNITLQILPVTHPHLPSVSGRTTYNTTIKLLQFLVTNLLISPESTLLILSARLDSTNKSWNESDEMPPKFLIHWRTCSPEIQSGSYYPHSWSSSLASMDPATLARTLGILSHEYPVLTGIFEFEFDPACKAIVVHTINNLEYLTKQTEAEQQVTPV
jgi:Mitochondrial protein up-regulated during meiosis